jgi:asparagine synthase (glutamine-hydrolysing)
VFEAGRYSTAAAYGPYRLIADMRLDHIRDLAVEADDPAQPRDFEPGLVLLRAWDRWGIGALARVEGDFAFCLWDGRRQELTLARDALGMRALHYHRFGGGIAFASMPSDIAAITGESVPDLTLLASYLCLVPELGHASFLRGIERVRPGHCVIAGSDGRLREERWWNPSFEPLKLSISDGVQAMRGEFDRAVAGAVVTDAPVLAAHLSGGLDSSLVVEAASRHVQKDVPIIAITGRIAGRGQLVEQRFEDVPLAAATARALRDVEHRVAESSPESPLDVIDRWMGADRPLRHPYNLSWLDATYEAAHAAGAKVLLCGDYGNATLSERGEERLQHLALGGRWLELARQLRSRRRELGGTWPGLLAMSFGPLVPARLWAWLMERRGRGPSHTADLAFLRRASPHVQRASAAAESLGYSLYSKPPRMGWALSRYLFMQDIDSAPMYHDVRRRFDLEVRDPTAARRVAELSLRLGAEHFFEGGQTRLLARRLLRGRVPDEVVNERRKGLQATNWLASAILAKEEFGRELDRIDEDTELSQLIDTSALRECLGAWPSEGWEDMSQMHLYRQRFTSTVALGRWARRIRERGG